MGETEYVVLVDDDGRKIGTAPKSTVHGTDTALHLAFSCHIVNDDGQVLVSRRALGKKTWPGVWTNSFCGHPQPGESLVDAVHRRAAFELGLSLDRVELELPDFRYRATDASGIVEYEICPVFTAFATEEPHPNPDEVVDTRWVDPAELAASLLSTPWAFSPWLVLQAERLPLFIDDQRESLRVP
jgi:isopentenyl-diphosphate Delta-isomerase